MKKLLSSAFAVSILFGWLFAVASAHTSNNDCKEVEFSNGTVCVSIENVSSDKFKLVTDKEDSSVGTLRCDIMLPDSTLKTIPLCNGTFNYDNSDSGRIKLRIRANDDAPTDREDKPSSSSIWTYPQWMYDFNNEEWMDSNLNDNNDNNNDYNTSTFSITASPSSPSINEYVDVNIKAKDGSSTDTSYRGTVNFTVQKKSWSSSWASASTSYYTLAKDSYTFTSSDRGNHDFSNLVKFKNDSYDYRLVVTDDNDDSIVAYKIFYVNGNGNNDNYNTSTFSITASPSSPSINEYVDVNVKAKDGSSTDTSYRGTVNFTVQKKSWSSSRATASTSYYTLADDSYTFTSSDRGNHDFSNLVKFKNDSYDYRLVVTDDDDDSIVGYKIFYINGDSNNNSDYNTDNFYVTASPSDPSVNEYTDVTVKARDGSSTDDSYRGTVNFSIQKRSSSSSSWATATTSYYTLARTSYTFTSSDDGEHDFANLVKFKNDSYDYRLVVTDDDDDSIVGYKIFYINGNSNNNSNGDLDNFYLTTDDSSPSTSQYVDLTVKARDSDNATITDFSDTVKFKVYYGHASSSSWTQTTNSSYYTMSSSYVDGYDFSSSNHGQKTFSDFIKFKNSSYDYKVRVYDDDADDNSIYKEIIFYVNGNDNGNNNNSIDGFTSSELSTVQSMYNSRPNMISNLKSQYSKLRNSTTWNNRSDTFYDDMNDIIDDNNSRTYNDYDAYYAAFLSRYRYTISIR